MHFIRILKCRERLSKDFGDGAASDDSVAVVENDSLTGGDGPLRFIKFYPGEAVIFRIDGGGLLRVAVTGLGPDTHGSSQFGEGEPVPVIGPENFRKQCFIGTDGNGILFHIFAAYIDGGTHGKAQALPLTQCVADSTLMRSNHISV